MQIKIKIHYAWWIVASCGAIMVSNIGIALNCAGLFYAPVSKALGVGAGPISLYLSIHYIVAALFLPAARRILVNKDVRIVLTLVVLAESAAFTAMSTYTSVYQFYISGIFLGLGNSFVIFLVVPILIDRWFNTNQGLAIGISLSFMGVGGAIFNPIGGALIAAYGWRTAYVILGIMMAAISLPFTFFVLRDRPMDKGLNPFGGKEKERRIQNATGGLMLKEVIKTPTFYSVFLFVGLLGLAAQAFYHLTNYMSTQGYTLTQGSLVASTAMIGVILGKILVGYLNDKIDTEYASYLGITPGFVGMLLIIFFTGNGISILMFGAFLFGIGYSCTALLPPFVVKKIFGIRDYSRIYSYIMIASAFSMAFGASFYGFVYDLMGSYIPALIAVLFFQVAAIIILRFSIRMGVT